MDIQEIINDRYDPEKPMSDSEYTRLRDKFFWNLPFIPGFNDPRPEDEKLFERFLKEVDLRGEIFNPLLK